MKEAYQVYRSRRPTLENGIREYKCYCSECGCPVFSKEFVSEREECPHCHAEFSAERVMSYETWTAEIQHVAYTLHECGRDQ